MSKAPPPESVATASRDLIPHWMGLLRAVRLYDANNSAVRSHADRIRAAFGALADAGRECELAVLQDSIYIGRDRIREGAVGSAGYQGLVDVLRSRGIAGLRVDAEVSVDELERFSRLLMERSGGERSFEQLVGALAASGITHVELMPWHDDQPVRKVQSSDEVAKRIYLRSVGAVKEVFQKVQKDGQVHARKVKRVVQQMLQSMEDDPGYLLHLTSLKNYDEYTFNHSVNVSVLAIALGRRISLSQGQLYALGQAGMMHDLGKLCVRKEVLNKPGQLTPEERLAIQLHPVEGFVSVAAKMGVNDDTIRVALGTYEHHLNEDGTGYPEAARGLPTTLLSRIVAIVDRYDAMTSARVYRREPISPSKALSIMFHSQRNQYDQVLLRYFMNMMGYYPLGTVVRLSDGSVAIVVGAAPANELRHFPSVKIVLDPDGRPGSKATLDLSATAKDPEPLRIEQAVDADQYGIQVMDYLL